MRRLRCSWTPMQKGDRTGFAPRIVQAPGLPGAFRFAWDWNSPAILYHCPEEDHLPGRTLGEVDPRRIAEMCGGYAWSFWLLCPTDGEISSILAVAAKQRRQTKDMRPENLLPALVAMRRLAADGFSAREMRVLETALPANLSPGTQPLRILRRWALGEPSPDASGHWELLDQAFQQFQSGDRQPAPRSTIALWSELTAALSAFFLGEIKKTEAKVKALRKAVGFDGRGRARGMHQSGAEDQTTVWADELRSRLQRYGHGVRRFPMTLRIRPEKEDVLPLAVQPWRPGMAASLMPIIQNRRLRVPAGLDADISVPMNVRKPRPAVMPLALILDVSASLEQDGPASDAGRARNFYEAFMGLAMDVLASAPSGMSCAILVFADHACCSGWQILPDDLHALESALFMRPGPGRTRFPVQEMLHLFQRRPLDEALFLIATDGMIEDRDVESLTLALRDRPPGHRLLALRPGGLQTGPRFFDCIRDNAGQVIDAGEYWEVESLLAKHPPWGATVAADR